MIIGRALGRLFDGLSIEVDSNNIDVQFNYGNQDALDKFIAVSDKMNSPKYPLLFYVISDVKDFDGWKYCDTSLLIMMETNSTILYKERTDKVYTKYIEPIYQEVKDLLNKNPYFVTLETNKIDRLAYTDYPNYGIRENNSRGSSVPSKKSDDSIVTDYVDARSIKMSFKIKTNCIV